MPSFRYQALNADDQLVSGEVEAANVLQAIERLEADGLLLQSIANVSSAEFTAAAARPQSPAPPIKAAFDPKELRQQTIRALDLAKQVAPALRTFSQELPPGRRRKELQSTVEIIENDNVDAALASIRRCPEYWIPLLSASETTENAGSALRELVLDSQRVAALRRHWWRALAYPAVILLIAAGVFTLISFLVIPSFNDIFADFGLRLPKLTLLIFVVSKWITSGQVLITLGACVAIAAAGYILLQGLPAARREKLAEFFRLPAGRSAAAAQLAGFTAKLIDGGYEPAAALQIAAYAGRSSSVESTTTRPTDRGTVGLARNSEQSAAPASLRYALRATMPTAARVRVLEATRDNFAERTERFASWTQSLAGPFAIIVTGVIVGMIVLGLYLPLVSLIQNLSRTN